jgi:hypothetical protein
MGSKTPVAEAWHAGWMAQQDEVDRIDARVRARFENLGDAFEPQVHLARLVEMTQQAVYSDAWLFVAVGCALLAELIYGSALGGTYRQPPPRRRPPGMEEEWNKACEALRLLRDVCTHPALLNRVADRDPQRRLPIQALAEHLETEHPGLAEQLRSGGDVVMGEGLAVWAIQHLGAVGRLDLRAAGD